MFFRLNPESRLISGQKKGVLYDFLDNKVYNLSPEEKSVLELAEKSTEIEEICKKLGMPEASVMDIFEKFREKSLGEFYENNPYIEPLRMKSPISSGAFYDSPPQLTNFFVELNNSCHYNCSYCGKNRMKRIFGCIGCNVWDGQKKVVESDSLITVLDQAHMLGFGQIFLTGGNVLENLDRLSAVLNHCETLHFPTIFLTCHETHVTTDSVDFLNHYKGLTVFLNCDFPLSPKALKIADSLRGNLTLVPIVDVTDMSKEDVMKDIQNEHEKIQRKVGWQVDYCSADFTKDYCKIPLFGRERAANASLQFFEWCQEYHPCLGGILTVSSDGNVYVCRIMRDNPLGNVLNTNLSEIIRNKKKETHAFWNLTRDKITPCNSCEYRYSCMDCRAIEKDAYQTNLCAYDPHEGKWK
ncbi:MAG: hypothetical protein AYK18_02695 [Theionarchaea archaeon DG-70]|nr:MAG: hypothetical protein AYK18_02695 [Theionarchaea archaeon DG-70]